MNSVFLVKSPLQLLNAIEAKHYFRLNTEDCVLIIMGDRKSQPQILELANIQHHWGKVVLLENVNLLFGNPLEENSHYSAIKSIWQSDIFRSPAFNIRRLNRISQHIGEVRYIFMGYARYVYMRHFVNRTPHQKTFLLDDGSATIQIAKERKEGLNKASRLSVDKKIKLFAKKLFQRLKSEEKESLCFFTAYDVEPGEKDEVIKNNYDYIRSVNKILEQDDVVYFLGSPLSEAGIMEQKEYLECLEKVNNYFRGLKLVYVAHRREKKENLEEIRKSLNIDVVLFNFPIEYQIAMVGPRPKILASFVSSALDNCRLIMGKELTIISFKLRLKNCQRREDIELLYNYYTTKVSDNFSVIPL
jgi:hypothetical protein